MRRRRSTAPSKNKLRIDPDHRYWLGSRRFVGNTECLWICRLINDQHYNDYVRSRGTAVHRACEYYDDNDLDPGTLDPRIVGYVQAYLRFLRESRFKVRATEKMVCNKVYGFATTIDRQGRFPQAKRKAIVELKTGPVEDWMGLQTAGHDIAMGGGHDRYVLQLMNSGYYRLHSFKDPGDHKIFLAAVAVANWRLNHQ